MVKVIVGALLLTLAACVPPQKPERPEGVEFDQEKQHFVFTLTEPGLTTKEYGDQWDMGIAETKRRFYSALNDEEFKQLEIDQDEFLTKLRSDKSELKPLRYEVNQLITAGSTDRSRVTFNLPNSTATYYFKGDVAELVGAILTGEIIFYDWNHEPLVFRKVNN